MTLLSDRRTHRRVFDAPPLGRLLLPLSIGAIALFTLGPTSSARSAALTPLSCLVCGDFGAVDVVLNTGLFIPLGLSLGLRRMRGLRVVLVAFAVSFVIEMLQLFFIPGRDASLSDVLTNSAGGALGAWIALHWRRLLLPDPRTARALCTALFLGWMIARVLTAWLLRPAFPDTLWYGQVAPTDVYPADFRGTVLRGTLGTVPARSGAMPELNGAFRRPAVSVNAVVTGALPTGALASVLSVLDEHRSEVVVLGQEGEAARLRFRLRTADLRFRTPSLRLAGALSTAADDSTELVGALTPGMLTLSSTSPSHSASTALPLGPGLGWALLLPFDTGLTPESATVATAVCTAAALLVIGFFAGRAAPRRPLIAVGLSITAAAAGVWLPVLFFPEAAVAAPEALGALSGAMGGALLGTRSAYRSVS